MRGLPGRRYLSLLACVIALAAVLAAPAWADFPYGTGPRVQGRPGRHAERPERRRQRLEVLGHRRAGSPYTANPRELFGVRGAHVVDPTRRSTPPGRRRPAVPTCGIAVLDSGIKWNDAGAMLDLRRKTRLNRGELPLPRGLHASTTATATASSTSTTTRATRASTSSDPRRVGPAGVMTPQDLLIAFSNGDDGDGNGFADDIAGWDFLDNDNDAYDDVQYGHGTGEAEGSTAEANNGRNAGSCPNCMFIPLRVGDSFVADGNNFAQAVLYGVDNGVLVIQEALGTLNQTAARAPGRRVRLRPRRRGDRLRRRRGRPAPQLALELSAHDRRQLGHEVRHVHADAQLPPVQRLHELLDEDHGRDPEHELLVRRDRRRAPASPGLIYSAALNARDAGDLDDASDLQRS